MNRLSKLAAGEDQPDYFDSPPTPPSDSLIPKVKSPRDLVPQFEILTKRPSSKKMTPQWRINLLQYGAVALIIAVVVMFAIMAYTLGVVSRELYIISNRTKPIEPLLEQILRNQDRETETCQPDILYQPNSTITISLSDQFGSSYVLSGNLAVRGDPDEGYSHAEIVLDKRYYAITKHQLVHLATQLGYVVDPIVELPVVLIVKTATPLTG